MARISTSRIIGLENDAEGVVVVSPSWIGEDKGVDLKVANTDSANVYLTPREAKELVDIIRHVLDFAETEYNTKYVEASK